MGAKRVVDDEGSSCPVLGRQLRLPVISPVLLFFEYHLIEE